MNPGSHSVTERGLFGWTFRSSCANQAQTGKHSPLEHTACEHEPPAAVRSDSAAVGFKAEVGPHAPASVPNIATTSRVVPPPENDRDHRLEASHPPQQRRLQADLTSEVAR